MNVTYNQAKTEAMAEANAHLNNVDLPSYTDLAAAANAVALNPDSVEARRALGAVLDRIPGF